MVGMKELGQMLFWGSFYGLVIVKQNWDANVMVLLPQIASLVPQTRTYWHIVECLVFWLYYISLTWKCLKTHVLDLLEV